MYTKWYASFGSNKRIKSISIRDLSPNISKVVNNIHDKFDRYRINRHDKPEVIMISVEDYEGLMETINIQTDKELMTKLKKSENEISKNPGKTLKDINKEFGIV